MSFRRIGRDSNDLSYYGISSYDDFEAYLNKNINFEDIWLQEKFRILDDLERNFIQYGEIKGEVECTKKYNTKILQFLKTKLNDMGFDIIIKQDGLNNQISYLYVQGKK